jgi:hypothetical protein
MGGLSSFAAAGEATPSKPAAETVTRRKANDLRELPDRARLSADFMPLSLPSRFGGN